MNKRVSLIAAVILFLLSCSAHFLAEYDAVIDGGAAALREKVTGFLTDLHENAGTPEADYAFHTTFYKDVRGDLLMLRTAARMQQGNGLTVESIDLIEKNVDELEALHLEGLSQGEIEVVATLFDTQFRMVGLLEQSKKRKED